MQTLYACPNVRTRDERRAAQPAADEGVPRAGLHRGDLRARVPARRARGEARRRPARAAPPQPRRHRARRRARVLEQEPARVLPPRRAALGAPPRGARPLDRHRQARRRAGLADLVRRRRPAELRLDPRRLERPRGRGHRRPGRRHRHEDGARADRGRGARDPARARDDRGRRLGPRPVRDALGRLVDDAVDGAGGARRRRPTRGGRSSSSRRSATTRDAAELSLERRRDRPRRTGAASRSRSSLGLLGNGQILGAGARGPNPAGMHVLTFGVQVAEVAVDVETGEVTVERIAAIHDVGRVINPLGASSQIEGGIIQGIGHTLSEQRLIDPAHRRASSRGRSTPTGCRRSPTSPRSSSELVDVAGRAADEPRLEGDRRAADHPDRRRDRERDPRRDRRRRPLAADHARGDAAGPFRRPRKGLEGQPA